MTTKILHTGTAARRVSGVYVNPSQAETGVRELELGGFQPSVSSTGTERKARDEENSGLEEAPPLDDLGVGLTLTGTLPTRARADAPAASGWTEGETSVSVRCRDLEEAERVDRILRRTGARNVQNPS